MGLSIRLSIPETKKYAFLFFLYEYTLTKIAGYTTMVTAKWNLLISLYFGMKLQEQKLI